MLLDIFINNPSSSSTLKDIAPFIGPFLIILTFTLDRILSARTRRKEIFRSWYYKAILEPNLEKIEVFFKETYKKFENAVGLLKSKNDPVEVATSMAICIREFQNERREFEFDFIDLAQTNIQELRNSLTLEIQEIDDMFVNSIDKYSSPNDINEVFRNCLMFRRSRFYQILYSSLRSARS